MISTSWPPYSSARKKTALRDIAVEMQQPRHINSLEARLRRLPLELRLIILNFTIAIPPGNIIVQSESPHYPLPWQFTAEWLTRNQRETAAKDFYSLSIFIIQEPCLANTLPLMAWLRTLPDKNHKMLTAVVLQPCQQCEAACTSLSYGLRWLAVCLGAADKDVMKAGMQVRPGTIKAEFGVKEVESEQVVKSETMRLLSASECWDLITKLARIQFQARARGWAQARIQAQSST